MDLQSNSFIEILKNSAREKTMLVENGRSISAGELMDDSISIALKLISKGVCQGDRVVIAYKPGAEFLKLIYANMFIRTVISIIDPEMGRDNYKAKLNQFNPQHVFVDSRLILLNEHPILKFLLTKIKPTLPIFPSTKNCQIFTLGKKLPILRKHVHLSKGSHSKTPYQIVANSQQQDEFLVIYTSGTLTEPKGVVHTYESLEATMTILTDLLNKGHDQTIATHLPHFMLLGINAGRVVYLWENELKPVEKLSFIEENQITTIFGPPSDFVPMMNHLLYEEKSVPNCVKNFYFGSAPVHAAFLEKFAKVSGGAELTCLYGMTENLMVCSQNGREKIQFKGNGDLVGKPFQGVEITIQTDGEICVKSNQKFKRYWHDETGELIHKSGDLGEWTNENMLSLIGRKKDMIIRGNFNIYPGLYEPTINKIPGVTEAVLIGVYDSKIADERVFLVIEAEQKLSKHEIMQLLKSGHYSIDKETLPDEIIFMPLLRFGRQNKVDRKKIKQHLQKSFAL